MGGDAVEEGEGDIVAFEVAGEGVGVRGLVVAPGEEKGVLIRPGGVGGDLAFHEALGLAAGDEAGRGAGHGGFTELPGIFQRRGNNVRSIRSFGSESAVDLGEAEAGFGEA
jgi:hypothetical protein